MMPEQPIIEPHEASSSPPNSNDSSDPTSPPSSKEAQPSVPDSPSPAPPLFASLPGARDFHRQQLARLQDALRLAVPFPDPKALLDQSVPQETEDPKDRLDRLEKQALQVDQEIQATKVHLERQAILEMMARLDLPALKVLKDHLEKLTSKH